jgi:cytochrome c oxidase cbb3-type subunit II
MNSLKSFVFAIGACVAVPAYFMALRPYAKERERQQVAYQSEPDAANPNLQPKDPEEYKGLYYPPSFSGDNKRGELVYIREGCAQCHTQVVRPDYAGIDQWKRNAGREQEYKKDEPVAVRQTHAWDYMHEDHAMIGIRRVGPDLANAAYRFDTPERKKALFAHLYAPRATEQREWSICPSFKHLFEVVKKESPEGRGDAVAITGKHAAKYQPEPGFEIIPTAAARDLVEYIRGLKRDYPLPAHITGAQASENIDYSRTASVARLHAAAAREAAEPVAKSTPVSLWVIVLLISVPILAGAFFGGNIGEDSSIANVKGYLYEPKPPPGFKPGTTELSDEELRQPDNWIKAGQAKYASQCLSCHGPGGEGQPGIYPHLKGSEFVIGGEKRLLNIITRGIGGPLSVDGKTFNGAMSANGGGAPMTDKDLAMLMSYIRNSWGNKAGVIYEDQVKALRAEMEPGAPSLTQETLLAIPKDAPVPPSKWPAILKDKAAGAAPAPPAAK